MEVKNKSLFVLISLGVIFTLSAAFYMAVPIESTLKEVSAIPGIAALFIALSRILFDNIEYARTIAFEREKEEFNIAITSHMADIAFDKHISFCEEYLTEMNAAVTLLLQKGTCEEMFGYAARLHSIKVKYQLWITKEIETKLNPFEKALQIIGANAGFYNADRAEAVDSGAVKESHKLVKEIFGYHADGSKENNEIRRQEVIQRIREIIGIEELTALRIKKLGKRHQPK